MSTNAVDKSPHSSFNIGAGEKYPCYDAIETGRIPNSIYFSDEQYEKEIESIFRGVWLCAAFLQEIPQPGDYLVKEIIGISVIIQHGTDGRVRAFYNACAHRSAKLAWDEHGNSRTITCPYHGWTYASDGKLVGIPDLPCFKHVDKETSGLASVHCEVWTGFVFLNFDPAPALTLKEYLGDLGERLSQVRWDDFPFIGKLAGVADCNWKLPVENGSEAYHGFCLHKNSLGHLLASDNRFLHPIEIDYYGPHTTAYVTKNPEFSLDPSHRVRALAATRVTQLNTGPQDEINFTQYPGINLYNDPAFASVNITMFPNCLMFLSEAGWTVQRYWPLDSGRVYFETHTGFTKAKSWSERFAQEHALANYRDTTFEDMANCEQQYQMLLAGAFSHSQFGNLVESAIRRYAACVMSVTETDSRKTG